jgi:hypothetical protein
LLTAALWLAAIGAATYWVMRFMDRSQLAPGNAREVTLMPAPQALNWPTLASHFGVEAKAGPVVTDVKVLGIVLPSAKEKARAVLMIESTKTTIVAEVGKEITEGPLAGAVVERITPTEVSLNRSAGNTQSLAVPDAKDARQNGLVSITSNTGNSRGIPANIIPQQPTVPPVSMPPQAPNMMPLPSTGAMSIQAAARAAAQNAMEAQQNALQPNGVLVNGADGVPTNQQNQPIRQPKVNER